MCILHTRIGVHVNFFLCYAVVFVFKDRFLEFRKYHNFNLFSKLSESTFLKKIASFSKKSIELKY